MAETTKTPPALCLSGLSQTFPGVRALKDVDLQVAAGTVHALLGPNGSGKSTLVKALAGYHTPDPGCRASVGGVEFELGAASEARKLGIRFVHQDLGLVHELSAQDNVGLVHGYERGRFGRIRWRDQARVTTSLLNTFGLELDPTEPMSAADPVARTAVALVRAQAEWGGGHGLLVLDEPTASLPAREVDDLFRLIREIRDGGTAVLLISHRLDEVMAIADHATVLRNGAVVWDGSTSGMSVQAFARLIADVEGTDVLEVAPEREEAFPLGEKPTLVAEHLHGQFLNDVSISVRKGEVVGVAGLLGSGREELPYLVAGAANHGVSGRFTVGDVVTERMTIEQARALGIAFVPPDRTTESVLADFSVRENVSIASLPALRRRAIGAVSRKRERSFVDSWLDSVDADPAYAPRAITTLSGGNQQKAVLARWLSTKPRVLVVSEPTAGIDVGARIHLYDEFRSRAADGLAILMSSSDVEDLVASCDRVVVLNYGTVAAELAGSAITKGAIVAVMEGVHNDNWN